MQHNKPQMTLVRWLYEYSKESEELLRHFYRTYDDQSPRQEWLRITTAPTKKDAVQEILVSDGKRRAVESTLNSDFYKKNGWLYWMPVVTEPKFENVR